MDVLSQLENRIGEYVAFAEELRRKAPALGVLLGNREHQTHPGHMAFYESVGTWVDAFAVAQPGQPEVYRALEILLLSGSEYADTAACWYLVAIQGHGKQLISLLEEPQRERLRQRYESAYPADKRLPLQREVYKLLGGRKKKRFGFL